MARLQRLAFSKVGTFDFLKVRVSEEKVVLLFESNFLFFSFYSIHFFSRDSKSASHIRSIFLIERKFISLKEEEEEEEKVYSKILN